ncbi:TetR/AcrR family transcriptional regulator [Burkholderia multivorans]|uniref:TetR/AcrR family transcriptional regulator n=1 Tax=Burkholderia multivorans TaxID=87883 RepID=UPI001C21B671|nr:TetR/AcrR family transcriptional regulator [Burkholderia multivorans]MBU9480689.1 TetR/AcrR family transcriptional regulator [Burkholderia multivorans]
MRLATRDVRQHILETAYTIISAKGFGAVGLNEILHGAGVPKGSFYHYFGSKEAFGVALLENYFDDYMVALDALFARPGLSVAQRLMTYFTSWAEGQAGCMPKGKWLVVKLAAEVSELHEALRIVLERGTSRIIARLADVVRDGTIDGSLKADLDAQVTAATLYQLWLGTSVRANVIHDQSPMESALIATKCLLGLPANLNQ